MDFLFLRDAAPGRLVPGAPALEKSDLQDTDFAVRLADLFENLIFTFAGRCDSTGHQARLALRHMGPGGDQKKAARALQPFVVGFSKWLRSEGDLLTVKVPNNRSRGATPRDNPASGRRNLA
jgi:hypothetical protein